MVFLFTDYGWQGPWVGLLHSILARHTAAPAVIDLMHDAPNCDPRASGHLLAALSDELPAGSVCVAVVDPGVGTDRDAVVLEADDRWFVGPANGLLDVVAARAASQRWWRITRSPERDSATFHGRDLFAPVAAALARGEPVPGEEIEPLADTKSEAECAEVIYIDGFGNCATGLRPPAEPGAQLRVGDRVLAAGRTFADAPSGQAIWLVNSLGLVEIVAHQISAAALLDLAIGSAVAWVR